MSQQDETKLKQIFHEEMIKTYKRIVKEVKYKPTRRLDLINKYGGYEAAIKILPTDSNTFDFTLLWEAQRLDLSVEALVTKPLYERLFPKEVVALCQRRLTEYNYAPKVLPKVIEEPEITPYVEEVVEARQEHTELGLKQDAQQMDDFIDLLFGEESIPLKQDPTSQVLTGERYQALWENEKVFTEANKDLFMKIMTLETYLTPETLATLEGYNLAYPLYNVIQTLAKRIKRVEKIDLEALELTEKTCWQLLFIGTCETPKEYKWVIRNDLKKVLNEIRGENM